MTPEPPESGCNCAATVCQACAVEWSALYRVAVAARTLVEHLRRESRLGAIAVEGLEQALDRLEGLEPGPAPPDRVA